MQTNLCGCVYVFSLGLKLGEGAAFGRQAPASNERGAMSAQGNCRMALTHVCHSVAHRSAPCSQDVGRPDVFRSYSTHIETRASTTGAVTPVGRLRLSLPAMFFAPRRSLFLSGLGLLPSALCNEMG